MLLSTQFRDWRGAVSVRYRNRAEITLLMREQNPVFAAGAKPIRYLIVRASLKFNLLDSAFSQRCRGLFLTEAKMV